MGFKDMFRSKKSAAGAPQPGPAAPAQEPREQAPQAGEEQPRIPDPAGGHAETVSHSAAHRQPAPLPPGGPLHHLVDILTSRGADRARLTLVQSGNIMTHQTRQSTGQAPEEVENGTVDQGSPLFGDVADLYTEAMNTPRGPWRQLDMTVGPEQDGQRTVTVDYAFPDGQTGTEHYVLNGATGPGVPETTPAHTDPVAGSEHTADAGRTAEDEVPESTAERAGTREAAATDGTVGRDAAAHDDSVRVVTGAAATPAADGQVVTGADTRAPEGDEDAPRDTATDATASDEALLGATHGEDGEPASARADATAQDLDTENAGERVPAGTATDGPVGTAAGTEPGAERDDAGTGRGAALPEHIDESEFGGIDPQEAPAGPTGAAAAATASEDGPADAPQVAISTDVAPSYSTPAEQPRADAPAPGNLVLAIGDVQSRMVEAQRHLFGADGTARDVSTVLIRVRALGSYYDALTHVRLNGFWDQRPTFELVPKDLLKVQELKDDSYVEGSIPSPVLAEI